MLTRIGRSAEPNDAVDLLLECHARIRFFLAMARRVAEARTSSPDAVAEAAARVRRYFTEALPLHARDEEVSILPRLRGLDPSVDAELLTMEREHREHEGPRRELVAACEQLAHEPDRLGELAAPLGKAAAELERQFAAHLAREEMVIFPAMRRLFDRSADAAITQEIRERRTGAAPAAPVSAAEGGL